ncbi:Clavaminate synthase-like protein [Sarocladium strictum]
MAIASGATAVVSADDFEIPLVDFAAFREGDAKTKAETARSILSGFQQAGFIYLQNHGISNATVSKAFEDSAKFFKRPLAQKEDLAWTSPESNRGYVRQGKENLASETAKGDVDAEKQQEPECKDLKETMNIGREGDCFENHWPDSFDDEGKLFRSNMLSFFDQCQLLNIEIMRAIAIGLGLQANWFDSFCDAANNNLRLLHYPEVSADVFQKNKLEVRAGAHTDYGSITLLFQDMAGGLQVQTPDGSFIDATPIPDTVIVNAGDMLARWSNDTIKSTKHRVVEPPANSQKKQTHPARYSIAYFCITNADSLIEAIPGTYGDVRDKKYPGIKSGEYLVQRLAATF